MKQPTTKVNTESGSLKVAWQDLVAPVGKNRCKKCKIEYALLFGNGLCEKCLKEAGVSK